MRIAVLSSAEGIWGAEQSLLAIGRGAGARPDLEISLYSPSAELREAWTSLGSNLNAVETSSEPSSVLLSTSRELNIRPRSDRIIFFNLDLLPLAFDPRLAKIPKALDLHDSLPRKIGRAKLRLLSLGISRVIAVSEYTSELATGNRFTRRKVLHRPAPEITGVIARREQQGVPTFGVLGRVDPDKNIETVLDAHSLAPFGKIAIRGSTFAGPSNYRARLIDRANDIGSSRIEFQESTPFPQCFDDLTALIVARPDEPLGRTVLEAHKLGIPCIVPDRGGAAELVTHQEDGLIYRAGDPRSLAHAMELIADGESWAQMSAGAAAAASKRLTETEYAQAYLQEITSE